MKLKPNLLDIMAARGDIGLRCFDPTDQLSKIAATQLDFADEVFSSKYYGGNANQIRGFEIGLNASNDILGKNGSSFKKVSIKELSEPRQRDADGFLRFVSLLAMSGYCFENGLSVIDFGGHAGNLFYSTKPFINVKAWHIIDFPSTCKRGEKIRDNIDSSLHNILTFSSEWPESFEGSVIIMNGVVMHLPDPFVEIKSLLARNPDAFWLGNVFELNQRDMDRLTQNSVLVVSAGSLTSKVHLFSIVPYSYYSDIAKDFFSTVVVSNRGYLHPCLYKDSKTNNTTFLLESCFDYFYF